MVPFDRSVHGSAVKWHLLLSVLGSAILPVTGRAGLLAGLWAVWGWVSLNSFLIDRLLRWSVSGNADDRKKVALVCMVKFPVLYLAGFFIIRTRPVTLEGVFAGFTLFIAALVVAWIVHLAVQKRGK